MEYIKDSRSPLCTETFLQVILAGVNWLAPHVVQRSGSHSLTARKHGHCFVLHDALHRHPGNLFWPEGEWWGGMAKKWWNISRHNQELTITSF